MKRVSNFIKSLNDNLNLKSDNFLSKIKDLEKNQQIRLDEEYKEMFESLVSENNFINIEALRNYQFRHKISRQEYEKQNELYKKIIKEKIKEVENGKITYQEFFEIKREIDARDIK